MISSEKAVSRANSAVKFAKRHKWAVIPCLGAVALIYSAEFIRLRLAAAAESLREKCGSRSVGSRAAAFMLSAAFAFMTVIPGGASAGAQGLSSDPDVLSSSISASDAAASNRTARKSNSRNNIAETPEEIAERISYEGLPENNPDYRIKLNIKNLSKDVTVRFRSLKRDLEAVKACFDSYSVYTDDLYIVPVEVTLYSTEGRYIFNLSEGYSADVTFSVPEKMYDHLDDLKIIRLEDDGTMKILDSKVSKSDNGVIVEFNTDRLAVFAMVSYNTPIESEDVGSGAGALGNGVFSDIGMTGCGLSVFDEDKRRLRRSGKCRRRIFRIKRIIKERDLLL